MTAGREALVLGIVCATLYLTGTADVPFYTRGEPREGLVVREMLATGRWLVPTRPAGEPARKPPLYYWLAAGTLRALPEMPERALRLPSALLAAAAVLGTWAAGRALWGAPAGLPAALVLAAAFEWTRAATSARVDMTLAASLTAVLVGWMLVVAGRAGRAGLALAATGALLGTLAKGPVALILPALVAAALAAVGRDRRVFSRLRPALVLGVAAAGAGLWYALAFAREGHAFLHVVARENWLRFVDAEDHAHGIGYLVPLGLVGLLPWTPLLPLALVPLRTAPRPPAGLLAATWIAVGFVFFSLAQAKRSVYLLPLYPAVALLVGAGAAAPPTAGRLARVVAWCARAYAPAACLVAGVAVAVSLGLDPTAAVRSWLRPADAAGVTVAGAAFRAAAPAFTLLALATAVDAVLLARTARRAAWPQLVVSVALLMAAWTAAFDGLVHPAIARTRSLGAFLARVGALVPSDAPLYARFPADPGLRFYAPRPLAPWPPGGLAAPGHLLLWEDDWRRLRTMDGAPLRIVAVSDAAQPPHGHLALVAAPPGRLMAVAEPAASPPAPGVRTGSPRR